MGRMQALHTDLKRVLQRFVVPDGVNVVQQSEDGEDNEDGEAPRGMETCLSPASKRAMCL